MLSLLYSLTNAGKYALSALSWAGPRPQGLLALPTEILLLIMKELEWDDVIRLRTTCKTLQASTYSKELWTQLFCRYLECSMPTPFILPKSLLECSSIDLERIVWKSQASLRIPQPLQADKPYLFKVPKTEIARLHLVPGGRWLLAGCDDGSVWWYDLDLCFSPEAKSPGAGGPNLLLQSPLPGKEASENAARVIFSIDYTSECSDANATSQFKTLEHFNLAVCVTYLSPNLDYTTNSFQVWKQLAREYSSFQGTCFYFYAPRFKTSDSGSGANL
ncbi:hypothetical protein EST38_g14620 [Candolleomyces aberdarensis]|uniref:F-box domain-containing protein n=1 Tax=Candolleomyces aberdarensis TaxID=2316362 RepID=A0A4Q2CZG8_9AGAR|nr:hypothetical protein EST38_g14620 [Candolleomyces aberdarensis]